MAKVLKITKTDKTVHVVPVANKAFYEANNNRLPAEQKWKIEEIDEEEAAHLPFIDESFTTPLEAVAKVKDLEAASAQKDAEIERLKALIAASATTTTSTDATTGSKSSAVEVIELINAALSVEQVEVLLQGEERKTVKDAAAKKITALKAE